VDEILEEVRLLVAAKYYAKPHQLADIDSEIELLKQAIEYAQG